MSKFQNIYLRYFIYFSRVVFVQVSPLELSTKKMEMKFLGYLKRTPYLVPLFDIYIFRTYEIKFLKYNEFLLCTHASDGSMNVWNEIVVNGISKVSEIETIAALITLDPRTKTRKGWSESERYIVNFFQTSCGKAWGETAWKS